MRLATVGWLLGLVASFAAGALLAPLGLALALGEPWRPFAVPAVIAAAAGGLTLWLLRGIEKSLDHRSAFLAVTLSWILACLIGALPFALSPDGTPTWIDALFESVAGFTTTGATVLSGLEMRPRSLLLWRALSQWIGGMGMVLIGVAVLPVLGIGGMQLYRAEAPGPTKDKLAPRISETARILWVLYLGLTLLGVGVLWLEGMTLFDAICHAMCAIATGGFSPHDASLGYTSSGLIHATVTVLMARRRAPGERATAPRRRRVAARKPAHRARARAPGALESSARLQEIEPFDNRRGGGDRRRRGQLERSAAQPRPRRRRASGYGGDHGRRYRRRGQSRSRRVGAGRPDQRPQRLGRRHFRGSRVHAILEGGGSECELHYVAHEVEVSLGETVYTSGEDRVFPKGLPIGEVSRLDDGTEFREIFLKPFARLDRLDEVLVVTEGVHASLPEQPQPPASLLPPPGRELTLAPAGDGLSASEEADLTDADRVRRRYRELGESQGHTFGEGRRDRGPRTSTSDTRARRLGGRRLRRPTPRLLSPPRPRRRRREGPDPTRRQAFAPARRVAAVRLNPAVATLICVGALTFQTFLRSLTPLAASLDLPLVAVAYLALMRRSPLIGMAIGMLTGLAQDGLTHGPLGLYGMVNTIIGYAAGSVGHYIEVQYPGREERADGVVLRLAPGAVVGPRRRAARGRSCARPGADPHLRSCPRGTRVDLL